MRTLEAHHIYTLLDWHQDDWGLAANGIDGAPAWATLTDGLPNPALGYGFGMFGDPAQQRAFDNFWANARGPGGVGHRRSVRVDARVLRRSVPPRAYLLGYDMFNEPNAGTVWATLRRARPDARPSTRQLSAWYRAGDPEAASRRSRHIIWIEPNVFFDFAANTNLQDPQGPTPTRALTSTPTASATAPPRPRRRSRATGPGARSRRR